ncbi:MAG: efflux RND transporter periplasmic adaptor subunit [Rhodomicrobium sp.]
MLKEQAATSSGQAGTGIATSFLSQIKAVPGGSKWPWIVAAGVAALLAISVLAWRHSASRTNVAYTVNAVTLGSVIRTVTATGTVNPVLTIIVGSYDSGPIQQLYCDYNAQVLQGQICAKIDPRPYQTIVDQTKANLAVAKAQLEKDKANLNYTKLNSDRLAQLSKTQAVSQDQADSSKNAYDQSLAQIAYDEATIEQRQGELEAALVNLEYTNIVSPVNGTVVSRNVTMGQTLASSLQTPTLFLIATDLTQMQVDANVSESDIGGVKVGNQTTFTVDAFPKRVFEGVVAQVRQSPQTVQNVVTYDVVIGVNNKDLALKPGLTAATRIVTAERHGVIRVPDLAFRYRPSQSDLASTAPREGRGAFVWILRDGKPVLAPIKIGLDDDSFTEVLEGLQPGDRVVVGERAPGAHSNVPPPRL